MRPRRIAARPATTTSASKRAGAAAYARTAAKRAPCQLPLRASSAVSRGASSESRMFHCGASFKLGGTSLPRRVAQALELAVGVAVALEVGDEARGSRIAPVQKPQAGVDLGVDAVATIEITGREAGVVAEGAAPRAKHTVTVRAGEAGRYRDLLHPSAIAPPDLVIPGVVAAGAEGRNRRRRRGCHGWRDRRKTFWARVHVGQSARERARSVPDPRAAALTRRKR